MAKIVIEFEFNCPEDLAPTEVQKRVNAQLDNFNDGRFPWNVEALERAGQDIIQEVVRRACGKEVAPDNTWPRLIRDGFMRMHDD